MFVFLLYVAWKRGFPGKFARFVLFCLIKKRSFSFNLLCVLDLKRIGAEWRAIGCLTPSGERCLWKWLGLFLGAGLSSLTIWGKKKTGFGLCGRHTVGKSCGVLFYVVWPDNGVQGSWPLPARWWYPVEHGQACCSLQSSRLGRFSLWSILSALEVVL